LIKELFALYEDLDLTKVRFIYPRKFIFLCGGTISPDRTSKKALSLRDYLYRIRGFQTRLNAQVILAETATTLYRDSEYGDLISFEEDIARISSIVLVIAESPGSLAELGAFATNNTICHALRVIIQEDFYKEESFIRFGPIQRIIKSHNRGFIGPYPWRTNGQRQVVIRSISPHYTDVLRFVNGHLKSIPGSAIMPTAHDLKLFCIIYWIIHILLAVSEEILVDCIISLMPDATRQDILNKIYCLLHIARWIKKIPYSRKDYYHATVEDDPFDYGYKTGTPVRDTPRRKADVTRAMKPIEDTPDEVLRRAYEGRSSRTK